MYPACNRAIRARNPKPSRSRSPDDMSRTNRNNAHHRDAGMSLRLKRQREHPGSSSRSRRDGQPAPTRFALRSHERRARRMDAAADTRKPTGRHRSRSRHRNRSLLRLRRRHAQSKDTGETRRDGDHPGPPRHTQRAAHTAILQVNAALPVPQISRRRSEARAHARPGRQPALCLGTGRAPANRQGRACPSAEYVAEPPSQSA